MERKPEQISRDIAAFERKLSEAGANEVLIEALNKKLSKLKNELKGGQMSTRQLASNLLGARKKVREMAAKDFRELISRLARKPEYYFLKKYSKTEIKDDMARPAKPVGYRFVGRGNYEVPSKRQIRNGLIDGTVYSERRPKRSDVSRVAQLAKGGKITIKDVDWANDDNKQLGVWLLTSVDGNKILSQSTCKNTLEDNVMKYYKKKGSIAKMKFDEDSDDGLSWVTFGDLYQEVRSVGKEKLAKGGGVGNIGKPFTFEIKAKNKNGEIVEQLRFAYAENQKQAQQNLIDFLQNKLRYSNVKILSVKEGHLSPHLNKMAKGGSMYAKGATPRLLKSAGQNLARHVKGKKNYTEEQLKDRLLSTPLAKMLSEDEILTVLEHAKEELGMKKEMAKGGAVGKSRDFIVKIDLYERYDSGGKKKIKLKAQNIYDLFEKINEKSGGDVSYYISGFDEDAEPEEKQELKEMSDEDLLELFNENNGDGGNYYTIIEIIDGDMIILAGGDDEQEQFFAKGGRIDEIHLTGDEDWDKISKLFDVEDEDFNQKLLEKGQELVKVSDDFGWDYLILLQDGRIAFPDRNSGITNITSKPVSKVDSFVKRFKKVFESSDQYATNDKVKFTNEKIIILDEELPTTIKGNLNFENRKKPLGKLTTIDGHADFQDSQVTDLGNLTTIGDAFFQRSKIKSLGNLTTIKGDAFFRDSIITDLGNLTTIKGDAFFGDRTDLEAEWQDRTKGKMAKGGSMYAKGGEVAKYHTLGFYKGENVAMIFSSKSSEEFGPNKGGYTTSEKYTNLTSEEVKNMLPKFMKEYGLRKQSDLVKEVMSGKMAKGGEVEKPKRRKFLLYTNPNNSTNRAYIAIGEDVKDVLSDSKEYPGSYNILYKGTGTNEDLQKAKAMYSNYRFGNEEIMATGGGIDEVLIEIEQIKKKYPKSKVSYYFAKNGNGKNYVIEAKENGKVVYSSYQQNKNNSSSNYPLPNFKHESPKDFDDSNVNYQDWANTDEDEEAGDKMGTGGSVGNSQKRRSYNIDLTFDNEYFQGGKELKKQFKRTYSAIAKDVAEANERAISYLKRDFPLAEQISIVKTELYKNGGGVGKIRDFIVKIDLYEKYIDGSDFKKEMKLKAKNIYDLFEKLYNKNTGISYYLTAFEFEETEELKQMSDKDLCKLLDEEMAKSSNNNYFTIIEIIDGNEIVLAGGDRKYEFGYEYMATGGSVNKLPTNLQRRVDRLKSRISISKETAIKAFKLSLDGQGAMIVGYDLLLADRKRDAITFGDLAIDLGRFYSGKPENYKRGDDNDPEYDGSSLKMAKGGQVDDVQAWIRYDGYSDKQIESVFDGLEEAGYDFPKDFKIYEKSNQESFNNKVWDKSNAMSTDVRIEFLPGDLTRKDVSVIIYGMIMTASTQYGLGGDIKAFFSATKETLKKGYNKSKEYTKKKIHDTSKKIALDVIDNTKDKVRSNRDKMTLKGAEEIVSKKYAKGGGVSKTNIRKINDEYYEDAYGNGISLMEEEDGSGGYWFLDTLMEVEGKMSKLKSEAKKDFKSHIAKNYTIVKQFPIEEEMAKGGGVGNFYVYGKYDEEKKWDPIKEFISENEAQNFISKAKINGVKIDGYPMKFDDYKISKIKSKNWEDSKIDEIATSIDLYAQNKKIMESYREWVSDLRNQSYPRMSVSVAIKEASEYMLHSYSKEDLIEAIKNDSQIDMFGMETTWINALKRAKKPKMATGGNVNNYPSFEVAKTIRVDDMNITPGYYTYTGRENGGKGVYLNVHTKQTLGFDLDMLKSIKEKYPTDIQILMKKGGRVKKGNYSYIPQEEIDYLVTEYGKKIDGNKLLDGAYAKGNTKAPKITRTQFEEEDYEFAKGGGVGANGTTKKGKGDVGKSGTQYGYTLKEYELAGEKYGLFVSPSQFWKSQDGTKYKDFIGRTQTTGERDKERLMMGYGIRISIGLDLGSDKIPESAKKYVRDNNLNKFDKGGSLKKGNYSYIPQEEIDYLVTEYGKKIDGNNLLDGAYAKGNTKAPKMVRTQFEEEDYEFAKGGGIGKDKIFGFGDDAANSYDMDIEELEFNVENEYNFGNYTEGVDYEWNIARGDDFPHAITIKSATMIKDSRVKEFLDFITESKPKGYMAKGGEISVYNLRKGDRVKTRKGDIETIIKKTGSGSYETIENDYTHSPESLEFVSRPGRKMATGGSMGSRVNYQNDDFALVMLGGSIGSKTSLPIFVNGKMGSIVESGNNKEMLKEKAARMRKQLSAGERKHYGMSYTVVALTPAKVKEIERFKNK